MALKMNRLLLLIISLFVTCNTLSAQQRVDNKQQQRMISMIEKKASVTKYLHCNFKQEKTLKMLNHKLESVGTMDYAQPNKLKWQYTKPYDYTFIINGASITVQNNDHTNVIDARQNKVFKYVSQIMVNSVTGRCLSNSGDFNVDMYISGNQWIASLTPLKKQMKSMFKTIKLYINPQQCIVNRVELYESNNDVTEIQLTNYKINIPVNENTFDLN